MSKKKSINLLYLIGMIVVVAGCFLPLFTTKTFGFNGSSAWDYITSKGSGSLRVGSILVFAGAVAGIVFSFVNAGNNRLFRLISWIVSVAGFAWVIINNYGGFVHNIAKTFTNPGLGLFVVIGGWVVSFIGWISSK